MLKIDGYDLSLSPIEPKADMMVAGMLDAVEALEHTISCLKDEQALIGEFGHLQLNLLGAVRDYYRGEIAHRQDELRDIKARLADLGYAA